MKVKHLKSGEVYETTREEFWNGVESKGNGHKFEIVQDDLPIEVKSIRQKKAELEPEITVKAKTKK